MIESVCRLRLREKGKIKKVCVIDRGNKRAKRRRKSWH